MIYIWTLKVMGFDVIAQKTCDLGFLKAPHAYITNYLHGQTNMQDVHKYFTEDIATLQSLLNIR